nr:MAG TPA: Endodeoxyribonuclease RusA [Caudoviricetes sp.]
MTDTLVLPFASPPLRPNQRPHWSVRSRETRRVRSTTHVLAKAEKLAPRGSQAVVITTVWFARDRRRRDTNSLALFAKAAIDGLVDAGVLDDDDSLHLIEERYRIRHDPTNPRIELWIEDQ